MATTLLKIAADTQLSLAAAVTVGQTTATLSSASDPDGTALPSGKYGFTVDGDTSAKEYIVCDLVGTALTNVQNITRQGVASTGFANYHRVGATVTITDWAILSRMLNNLTGATGFDSGSPLSYDGDVAGLTGNDIPTVNYVLSVVNGGAVSFSQQVVTSQTAGEDLTIRDHVYLKVSDNKWYKVDADDTSTFSGVRRGIALATTLTNASLSVCISGPTSGFTGLTAGAKYYASGTAGALITPAPSSPTYSVFVGWALSTTSFLLNPNPTVDELSGTVGVPSANNKFVTALNRYSVDVDQSQTTQNATSAVGQADTTGLRNKLAQSFIPTTTGMRGVKLYKAANTGSFTGTVTVTLEADSAGSPSGSALATASLTNAQYLALATGEFELAFATAYTSLVPGTTYWIVIDTNTADSSNCINVGTNSAGGYGNGSLKYQNTVDGWISVTTVDLYFKTLNIVAGQVATADTNGLVPSPILPYSFIDLDTTTTSLSSSTTETTVYTRVLPADFFKTTGGIKLTGAFDGSRDPTNGGNIVTLKVKLNGTTVATFAPGGIDGNASTMRQMWHTYLINNGSLSSQKYAGAMAGVGDSVVVNGGATNGTAAFTGISTSGTSSVDTSGVVTITLTLQNSENAGAASFTQRWVALERIG